MRGRGGRVQGAQASDLLFIRVGLNYIILGEPTVSVGWNGAGGLGVDWKQRLHLDASTFVPLLKRTFPGRIVWWLLTPISSTHDSKCEPPLSEARRHIAPANAILRPLLQTHGVSVLDPEASRYVDKFADQRGLWKDDWTTTDDGFVDCVHFFGAGLKASVRLLFNVSGSRRPRASRRAHGWH